MGILTDKTCSWFSDELNRHDSALCDVNETLLSCRIEQCGGHTRYQVYMDMDAAAGFDLRML